jgi:hypothetical protein
VRKKRTEKKGVERRWMATRNWNVTTARVRYFVRGSWPQSFVTFFSVYVEKGPGMVAPLDELFVLIGDVSGEVLLGLPSKSLRARTQLRRSELCPAVDD